jgi:hypothetical protein
MLILITGKRSGSKIIVLTRRSLRPPWRIPLCVLCGYFFFFANGFSQTDPDSTVKLSMDSITWQICEKDAGKQSVILSGIPNGTDISFLSLSQTNTNPAVFDSVPAFTTIQSNGSAAMSFTPGTAKIGETTVHLVLTYNRGDTVIKTRSVWFKISIITDPSMKIPFQLVFGNQPKVVKNITMATNCVGVASNLIITVSCANSVLITNLLAEPVKPDGTGKISFIPGQDQCGLDTIIAVLTDTIFIRSKTYQIPVDVSSAACIPFGVIDDLKKSGVMVWPNPTTGIVNLAGDNILNSEVFDITGKSHGMYYGKQIDLSSLPAGTYILNIYRKEGLLKKEKIILSK